jgi:hypothetical protein
MKHSTCLLPSLRYSDAPPVKPAFKELEILGTYTYPHLTALRLTWRVGVQIDPGCSLHGKKGHRSSVNKSLRLSALLHQIQNSILSTLSFPLICVVLSLNFYSHASASQLDLIEHFSEEGRKWQTMFQHLRKKAPRKADLEILHRMKSQHLMPSRNNVPPRGFS